MQSPESCPSKHNHFPEASLDLTLLVHALRRLVRSWRDRAATAPTEQAAVYVQVELDLSEVVSDLADIHARWAAVRDDLVRHLVQALRDASSQSSG